MPSGDYKWLFWASVSMLSWGVWAVFSAAAAKHGSALGAAAGALLVEAMMFIPWYPQAVKSASWWLLGAGIASAVAYGAFYLAFQSKGPAPSIVAITSMYPAISAILSLAILGTSLSWKQGAGIVLAIAATVLLSGG